MSYKPNRVNSSGNDYPDGFGHQFQSEYFNAVYWQNRTDRVNKLPDDFMQEMSLQNYDFFVR